MGTLFICQSVVHIIALVSQLKVGKRKIGSLNYKLQLLFGERQ